MLNPVEVLEKAGVDNCEILWAKRIVRVKKEDLPRIMEQFPELKVTAFAVNGWLFTAEEASGAP